MLRPTSRHAALAVVVLIVLGLVVPPFVNVGRYRIRIADSMSRALGRPVTFDKISLRLLPQPGFDFENLVVGDDPAYSAEPMLRSDEVTAYLRMASLWRGRMEIARLQLSYPSLNLVRRAEGDWNLESLLYRASQTAVAPTSAKTPEARPRFPYIEASDGRINFKYGLEKKVFALTDAKFALWSPGQDEWRMRLEAKPVRTDIVIADSGVLRAEGSLHRAEYLRDMKLDVQASLERSQLGQLTRLIWGRDRGWRGALGLNLQMTGTPANLSFQTDASVQDFRRYDIMRGEALRLQTHCTGKFSSVQQTIDDVNCTVPAGNTKISLKGSLKGWQRREFGVSVNANNVPLDWVMAVARHTKRDLPDDLTATGTLSAGFTLSMPDQDTQASLAGDGETKNFVLKSALLNSDLPLGKIQMVAGPAATNNPKNRVTAPARLEILPFPVPLGSPVSAVASGSFRSDGYNMVLQGDGEVSRIMQLARALGIGVPKFQLKGSAKLNVGIGGPWKGFTQAAATGTMLAKNVAAEIPGLNAPLKIASADVTLSENTVVLRKLAASADLLKLTGTATFPRHCEEDQPCASQVNVQFDDLDLAHLNALLNPSLKRRPWYKLFGSNEERSLLATWQANGKISARHLTLRSLAASRLDVDFTLKKGKLQLKNLESELLGGGYSAAWSVDFTSDKPVFESSGTLSKAAVAQIAALTNDPWGTGQMSGSYKMKFEGISPPDLANSLEGDCDFTWREGLLRHLALDGKAGPMKFPVWAGHCKWSPQGLVVSESKLQAVGSIYGVSGTIKPSRDLRLEFVRGDGTAYQVTGTLEKPQVAATPAGRTAEASLHP